MVRKTTFPSKSIDAWNERVYSGKIPMSSFNWTDMLRKKGFAVTSFGKWTGLLRKKVVSIVILSICSSFLQVDGRQNDAFSCFTGALKHLRKLNGYGADYAFHIIVLFSPSERKLWYIKYTSIIHDTKILINYIIYKLFEKDLRIMRLREDSL